MYTSFVLNFKRESKSQLFQSFPTSQTSTVIMHLSSASLKGGGGPRADVGTLLIVHFKVLVFPHRRGIFFWQSPQYMVKPNTQQDEKTHFMTSVLFFEQLAPDIMIKT